MLLDNLHILIVNADADSRYRLREVIKSFIYKCKISYAQNLSELKKLLEEKNEYDVGFISFDLGKDEISKFISGINEPGSTSKLRVIVTLKSRSENTTSQITNLYMEGIEGFISEPYSSDDILRLLSTITERKEKIEKAEKMKKASGLLLLEAARQIDNLYLAQLTGNEFVTGQTLKSFKTLSQNLEPMYNQDKVQYADALVSAFENIDPPKPEQTGLKKKTVIKEVPHPGKIIAQLMTQRKITIESLKHTLKMEPADFQSLLDGNLSINETTSREISRIFGKTSKEWMKMQSAYDTYAEQVKNQKESNS